ncbi:50S ribosomal protein L10 [candidate division WWE3 bacterium CG_4_9_14_0_2_um_filter_35_11]|uniref:Large ribosomal subunit protein uL10 n=1 Tax=candidate division WWE3 bacterium CG_4_9_14_0_2_um_filter_35_11 TaxID=1975077 RepID=A0A2M8EM43_UNCKA|nr:MAG: 50S ribosomal protein L10 [candidate division WWE3 bacterium CG10_big_fil_rev_8_21_14_0_10_35_32]PJC23801.1 MAG: 50S ribosomal protein L10 [candidate division WWE3 bacterium CG_4_9_14_0_2_um_filter_35_11]
MSKNIEIKKEIVAEVVSQFDKSPSTAVFNYTSYTSNEMNELRGILFDQGSKLRIVKNTLVKKILGNLNVETKKDFSGQNAILIPSNKSPESFISGLKTIFEFIKKADKGSVSIGVLNGEIISGAQVEALSKLPSRQELLGQVVYGLMSPIRGFAYTLNEIPSKFVRVLGKVRDSKEA